MIPLSTFACAKQNHLVLSHWTWDPLGVEILFVTGVLYGRGLYELWTRAGVGRGIKRWQAASFALGWIAIAIALISPLDSASDVLFSAHMSQHEVLMLIGAPLLVLGRGLIGFLWGLPDGWRAGVTRTIARPGFVKTWRALTAPIVVLVLHGLVLWLWHVPSWFEAALESEAIHALQHFAFFFTAALFFWALIHGRYGRGGYGVSVLFVFITALHTGLLGALVTFAKDVWYPTHGERTRAFGIEPYADQQLAGLIMWIPAGLLLAVVGLALFAAWLGESDKKAALGRAARATRSIGTLMLFLFAGACSDAPPSEAVAAIRKHGCASCHQIPGIGEGRSKVGPPLGEIAQRRYLGGGVANTKENMMLWIQRPQSVQPGTAMPDLPLTDREASAIADYLYGLD
jgi:putative membrane protein